MPKTEGGDREQEMPEFERDLTDWSEWRLKNKDWLLDYIKRQKTRHEDLIMKNALSKIESEMSGSNTIRRHQVRARLQRGESIHVEPRLKPKPIISQGAENSNFNKTVPKCAPRKVAERRPENFLTVRSLSEEEDIFHEKPRRIHKEMTKVKMRSLSEPLPMILENPTKKKTTSELPLITISKA